MTENKGKFNSSAFYSALNRVRESQSKLWKHVAEESGVPASTLTRMSQGRRPDVDSLAALSDWSGLNPADFIQTTKHNASIRTDTMAVISRQLSSDPYLDEESSKALQTMIEAAYKGFKKK